ncbi:MAG: endonuclease/exonuclease/phosphatase family protein [Bacteroidales bacterium]|nr:endonuclease/exonuclease/phosphatase family protein [Bacteroidales bacterium]
MKKYLYNLTALLAVLVLLTGCGAQKQVAAPLERSMPIPTGKSYVIGFYNLENLFDTYHDEGKNDYEYLPDGANQWTEAKYQKKLSNMAQVIAAMKQDNGAWHTILGVSEIENRHVLEDLVADPQIAEANYQIVHYDGPDTRGVDVALFYKPDQFTYLDSESIPFDFNSQAISFSNMTQEEKDEFRTRDILMVHGTIDGEHFAFYVCHLPSRLGEKSGDLRSRGGEIIYQHSRQMMQKYPGIKCVVMGDMNDNPTDDSMAVYLRGKENIDEVGPEDYFSPFLSMLKAGFGSLAYRGEWNIYDCILVSNSLAHPAPGTLGIIPITNQKFYGRIFSKPFMTQQTGQYKNTPFRTSSNGAFIGGYSDHYPTYIVIKK